MKRTQPIWLLRNGVVVCTLVLCASFPNSAWADGNSPDPDASSVDQYVEAIPTSSGNVAPGAGQEKKAKLSVKAKRALDKAPPTVVKALEEISTSSSYGAPTKRFARRGETVERVTDPSVNRALRAGVGAIGGGSAGRLLGLLGVLLATTAGLIAVAARKHTR